MDLIVAEGQAVIGVSPRLQEAALGALEAGNESDSEGDQEHLLLYSSGVASKVATAAVVRTVVEWIDQQEAGLMRSSQNNATAGALQAFASMRRYLTGVS